MKRFVAVGLVCCGLLMILVFNGSSRHTLFPTMKQIKIRKNDPRMVFFKFNAILDGMEKIHLRLPGEIKRRPIKLMLFGKNEKDPIRLMGEDRDRYRSERTFHFEQPLENCKGKTHRLCLVFEDGMALQDGFRKASSFRDMSVTIGYRLNIFQALKNYQQFKPFSSPFLATGLLFLLYFVFLVSLFWRQLLRVIRKGGGQETPGSGLRSGDIYRYTS